MTKVYFDNAATTPISNDVINIITQVMKNNFGIEPPAFLQGRFLKTILREPSSLKKGQFFKFGGEARHQKLR